jgi:FixJ family two-component response regulator
VSVSQAALISVVDDDSSVREAIESLLKSVGYRVALYSSAEEFLNLGSPRASACLILDVRMPGMSGLELQCRLTVNNISIPIIFVSAHSDGNASARALALGAVAFLQKPFSEEALLSAIDVCLATGRGGAVDGLEPDQPA